jgi:GNAT superfamily N-acetyltransferase
VSFLRPAPRLRPARPEDVPALVGIIAEWAAGTDWLPRATTPEADREAMARLLARAEVTCLCGWRGMLGFIAREGEEVQALYLARSAQGRGHGARLMATAQAASPRLFLWVFPADWRARAFYARQGFREIGRGDGAGNDQGLPEIRLEWRKEG